MSATEPGPRWNALAGVQPDMPRRPWWPDRLQPSGHRDSFGRLRRPGLERGRRGARTLPIFFFPLVGSCRKSADAELLLWSLKAERHWVVETTDRSVLLRRGPRANKGPARWGSPRDGLRQAGWEPDPLGAPPKKQKKTEKTRGARLKAGSLVREGEVTVLLRGRSSANNVCGCPRSTGGPAGRPCSWSLDATVFHYVRGDGAAVCRETAGPAPRSPLLFASAPSSPASGRGWRALLKWIGSVSPPLQRLPFDEHVRWPGRSPPRIMIRAPRCPRGGLLHGPARIGTVVAVEDLPGYARESFERVIPPVGDERGQWP